MFGVWGRFVAEVHPAYTAKNCRPREEKHPLLSVIALYFAHVKSVQLALEAALGALRDLLIFGSSVPAQSGSPKVALDTCYLWSARFGSRGGG